MSVEHIQRQIDHETMHMVVAFLFDEDGLGAGEHAHAPVLDESHHTPVEPELVPEVFWSNPVTGRVVS